MSSAVTKVKSTVKQAVTKVKKQYEKKTHTEKVGKTRSPKRMTDGAKKEQKKALKKIKTTIQKTGSRLAAAGTAAASRQQSRKTHTEKVGTGGNPRKKMSSSVKKAAKDAFDIHPILDAVGFVPVLGEPADLVNGLIYVAEKYYINAGISMAAVIPVVGDAGKAVKYGAKAVDKGEAIAKTLNVVRKPLAKNESKQFKATAKGIKKASKGKADKVAEVAKGGNTSVQHAVGNANQAQSVLEGINPKYFNPESRFGGGFYVGTDFDTIVAELSEHGNTAKYAISYDMNLNGQKVLDLTNLQITSEWGYVQNLTSTKA